MLVINFSFSYPTRLATSYLPDPWFRIYVGGIHKAKVRVRSRLAEGWWC